MKNPNGYGTIKKLSGNRRRPFAFVVTDGGARRIVSYHATRQEALVAQADYWRRTGRPRAAPMTFSELYTEWLPLHVQRREVSRSAVAGYRAAFFHCRRLWDMPLDRIRYSHAQSVLDDMQKRGLSYSSRKKCRSLITMLFDFARRCEYCQTSFRGLLWGGKNKPVRPHRAMTRQQINRLWRAKAPYADTVLILIYTGLRVGELLAMRRGDVNLRQRVLSVTHSKTEAGIRIIPIHPLIMPLIRARMERGSDHLITADGGPMSYAMYRRAWDEVMRETRGKYTPHDTRHTFASLLDAAEVNENARRRLLGHAGGNITDGVYTHKTMRQLRTAIEKIK